MSTARGKTKIKESEGHRFIADCMLGTLAKRLRMLGYDTLFFKKIEDSELIKIAVEENRTILTRDSGIIKRKAAKNYVFIESDEIEKQLGKVVSRTGIDLKRGRAFSRCLVCNMPLESIRKRDVIGKVPPFVFLSHSSFSCCRSCNKIYWKGTHIKNAVNKMNI